MVDKLLYPAVAASSLKTIHLKYLLTNSRGFQWLALLITGSRDLTSLRIHNCIGDDWGDVLDMFASGENSLFE